MRNNIMLLISLLIVYTGLSGEEMSRLGIDIQSGWNLVSFNVEPANIEFEQVFSELISEGDLVQIKTISGSFLPGEAEYLNTISSLESGAGYALRSETNQVITVNGDNINPDNCPIMLQTGWNIVGYLPQENMAVETAFAALISSGILEKVQSENESFDPDLPGAFNTLNSVEPGKAYWVQVNAEVEFYYPNSRNTGRIAGSREMFPRPWETVFYPSSTIAYCNVTIDSEPAAAGDEVGSFINGECRGVGVVFIMGGNATTFFSIQSTEVTTIHFNVWDASEDEVLEVIYETVTNPGGDIGYPPNQLPIDAIGIVQESWEPVVYKHSTTFLGRAAIEGNSAEAGDIVAAFSGDECRGSQEVVISNGVAYVTLLVHGEIDEEINFKIWDVSADEQYELDYNIMSDPGEIFGYPPEYLPFIYGEIVMNFDLPAEISFISGETAEIDLAEYIAYLFMDELSISYTGNEQISVSQTGFELEFIAEAGWYGTEQLSFALENTINGEILEDILAVNVTPTGEVTIIEISDVPNDQGGFVSINFSASYYDTGNGMGQENYIIRQLFEGDWPIVNEISATGEAEYSVISGTQADSTTYDEAIESFTIEAVMIEGNWTSEMEQGYSVDNLAPSAPYELVFTEGNLEWQIEMAADLGEFEIYLDGEFWQATVWQQINMTGIIGEVSITCVDIHGNESEMSELIYGGYRYGDIDINLAVDAYDAALVLQYFCVIELEEFPLPWSDWRQILADVDGNESIEAFDAGLILRYSVDLIDEFPVENNELREELNKK